MAFVPFRTSLSSVVERAFFMAKVTIKEEKGVQGTDIKDLLYQLIQVMLTVRTAGLEAQLNKTSISDNNGERIEL